MAVLTLIITTIESFSLPASSAFTAQVIKKEHLTSGMSLSKVLTNSASLVGTGIAGVIISLWGMVPAMIIDISAFIIASILILLMNTNEITHNRTDNDTNSPSEKFITLFTDGMKYVTKTPMVKNFCILCVALNFMLVSINALQAPIAEKIYKMGSELLSFVVALAFVVVVFFVSAFVVAMTSSLFASAIYRSHIS